MRTLKALVLTLPALILTGEAVSVMAVGALLATPAHAAKDTVSAKVGKPLSEAQNLIKANDLKGALAKIKEAQAISGKTPYEEKTINEFLASVAIKQGDYSTAAKAFEDLLNSGGNDPQQLAQRLQVLTQLNYQSKNYAKAIQFGNRYLKEVGNNTDIALLITQAYYIQNDYNHSLEASQNLMKIAQAAGQQPKEQWLQLQRSSLLNLNRRDEALAVTEKLLANYPSKQYWKEMLGEVSRGGNLNDRGRVELYRLKRATDVLESDELVEMAELSMAIGVPGDAKSVLEAGFDAKQLGVGPQKDRENRLLNKARTDSAEDQKTLQAQSKQAAASPKGDLDVKVGEAFTSYGQYDAGVEAIKRGLDKGGVAAEDEAYLHLGQALYASKKYGDAAAAFKKVKSDSNYSRLARLWAILAGSKK